jgi:translation elongation factor EF-1beta
MKRTTEPESVNAAAENLKTEIHHAFSDVIDGVEGAILFDDLAFVIKCFYDDIGIQEKSVSYDEVKELIQVASDAVAQHMIKKVSK